MADDILVEISAGIGAVRISRPDGLNPLSLVLLEQIVAALERCDADAAARCILLAGGERAFGTGTDIAELAAASMIELQQRDAGRLWERIRRVRKPIVAAIRGYAIGAACELMLACDIIIAAENTRLSLPDLAVGSLPGAGGTQRLARVAGKAQALDLVLTGRSVSAREALAMGLLSRVVPRENYLSEAQAVCRELAKRPPLALQLAKQAILQAYEMPLAAGLDYERQLYLMLFATADQREGMRAFLEKRPPLFTGR